MIKYREALISDIKQIQVVRNAVKENQLSDPGLVPNSDVEDFITNRGKGWVCEINGLVVGFAIADLEKDNIWALFILPGNERCGIGKELHKLMLDWYFSHTKQKVWLGTAPGTRAEKFYRMQGWKEAGMHGKGEIKFEMTGPEWEEVKNLKMLTHIIKSTN